MKSIFFFYSVFSSIFLFYRSISLFHSFRCYCRMVARNQRNRIFVLEIKWNDSTAHMYIVECRWWNVCDAVGIHWWWHDGEGGKSQNEMLRLSTWNEMFCLDDDGDVRGDVKVWTLSRYDECSSCSNRVAPKWANTERTYHGFMNHICHLYPQGWASQKFVFHLCSQRTHCTRLQMLNI